MNHGFVIFPRPVLKADVDAFLKRLIQEKWSDKVIIEDKWRIGLPTKDVWFRLDLWYASPRKLEMRRGPGDFSAWLQFFVRESVAKHFGGKCGDQGGSQRWDPEPECFQTFLQWYVEMNAHVPKELWFPLYQRTVDSVPDFKEILGCELASSPP